MVCLIATDEHLVKWFNSMWLMIWCPGEESITRRHWATIMEESGWRGTIEMLYGREVVESWWNPAWQEGRNRAGHDLLPHEALLSPLYQEYLQDKMGGEISASDTSWHELASAESLQSSHTIICLFIHECEVCIITSSAVVLYCLRIMIVDKSSPSSPATNISSASLMINK